MAELIKYPIDSNFESAYLDARAKEARILSLEQIRKLPMVDSTVPNYDEWKCRQHSFQLFKNYFTKQAYKNILDLACGNGWAINKIWNNNSHFTGVDVNEKELKQATEVLANKSNCKLILGDIYKIEFDEKFDCIIVSAAIQYFHPLENIIDKLKSILTQNGELHILDSPFYKNSNDALAAAQRSDQYYKSIGTPRMSKFYHHHTLEDLEKYKVIYQYNPHTFINKILRKIQTGRNPFPWIIIREY